MRTKQTDGKGRRKVTGNCLCDRATIMRRSLWPAPISQWTRCDAVTLPPRRPPHTEALFPRLGEAWSGALRVPAASYSAHGRLRGRESSDLSGHPLGHPAQVPQSGRPPHAGLPQQISSAVAAAARQPIPRRHPPLAAGCCPRMAINASRSS